jgi:RimJ/RimL family protein N-acetyltransferase
VRSSTISFRLLTEDDLPLLRAWRADPEVTRWYGPALDRTEIETKYRPRIEGREAVDSFVIEVDGRPVGHVQRYLLADHPEYAVRTGVGDAGLGMDLYIGEADARGRGLGARVIERFAEMCFEDFRNAPLIVTGPDPTNVRAVRAFERAGFKSLRSIPAVGDEGPEHVLALERPDSSTRPGSA